MLAVSTAPTSPQNVHFEALSVTSFFPEDCGSQLEPPSTCHTYMPLTPLIENCGSQLEPPSAAENHPPVQKSHPVNGLLLPV